MDSLAADVAHIQHGAPGQLPLDAKAPLQHARLEILRVECIGVDDAGRTEDAEWISDADGVRVRDNAARSGVGECYAARKRRIQIQDGVVVKLLNVVINARAGANDCLLAQPISEAQARL